MSEQAGTFATCTRCEQPMDGRPCVGADVTVVRVAGNVAPPGVYQRVPYDPDYGAPDQTCHDCNTPRGGLHHPGCDMERCPVPAHVDIEGRRMQAISCGCRWEGDPEDEDDEEDDVPALPVTADGRPLIFAHQYAPEQAAERLVEHLIAQGIVIDGREQR